MIPFLFNENLFSFFIADHLLVGQLCANPKSDRSLLSCLKVIMFNERDRRCAAVEIMLSTDPTYDNMTIASTVKMQIRTVLRLRAQLNASDDLLKGSRTEAQGWGHRQEDPDQDVHQKGPGHHWWNLGVSRTTVNACVKEVLKCSSYRRQTNQILTEKTKNLRLIKSVRLLNKLKHLKKSSMLWFFSGEKNFCQDQVHTSQNHRWIATNNRDVPRVMKSRFPATVMVFGVVSVEGHIMPPYIIEVGLKVNTKMYLYVLKGVVIPWCNQVAGGRPWVWQQDLGRPTGPKRPRLGFRRSATTLYPSFTGPPPAPTWTRWTTSFDHMSRTSQTWPPTTPKPAWSPPSTEYSPISRRR